MNDDFLTRTIVWAMISFLLLEALLPEGYNNIAFLFLILQSTLIYVLGIARQKKIDFTATSARLFITYIALAALIVNTKDEK
ncbi:hypothetical protein ACOJUR_04040 [Alicyclobacillus tolerans]|uniref:Uncharacterized protein n=2 Tax=Alicyclobacillus tolerans TaxID=90970 RepID=A0A1M6NYD9_9BACL|nr:MULTISPECIES: hypothetical protein [Alicyclobacillus]MDP9729118.1 hypothetical protein [Alicyclobacillus tengchongensis]QRF22721.1 hypothetical protein FY534_02765 [Alicyclobacillus sp. TC]SHK00654.1 hypothetical protein SAMN05443507_10724 [Alicyclobacillus montanus]